MLHFLQLGDNINYYYYYYHYYYIVFVFLKSFSDSFARLACEYSRLNLVK